VHVDLIIHDDSVADELWEGATHA
jgi:hypothetical protein